ITDDGNTWNSHIAADAIEAAGIIADIETSERYRTGTCLSGIGTVEVSSVGRTAERPEIGSAGVSVRFVKAVVNQRIESRYLSGVARGIRRRRRIMSRDLRWRKHCVIKCDFVGLSCPGEGGIRIATRADRKNACRSRHIAGR